jgi:hypothetical protein
MAEQMSASGTRLAIGSKQLKASLLEEFGGMVLA